MSGWARKQFDEMSERNSISYNTMIGVYSRDGDVEEAWNVFSEMKNFGFVLYVRRLLSCVCLNVYKGCYLQALTVKNGLLFVDAFAGTVLAVMFGRNGCLDEAVRAFEDMPLKNLVTWNSIISLFGHHGYGEECFSMFCELTRIEVFPSECTLVGVLSGFVWEDDKNRQVTIAFNHFRESLVQRIPRCRHGYFHVVNNDYTHWEMYVIGGSASPTISSQGYRFSIRLVV